VLTNWSIISCVIDADFIRHFMLKDAQIQHDTPFIIFFDIKKQNNAYYAFKFSKIHIYIATHHINIMFLYNENIFADKKFAGISFKSLLCVRCGPAVKSGPKDKND